MNQIKYKIKLLGIKTREGTIPLTALKDIAESLLNGSECALRLSVEGASKKRGKIPEWLKKSLDLTVTGISKGSTILEVEAPTLLESAPDQVQQQDLWYTRPEPEDTPLSIFSRSVLDATSENTESEYYDQGVLSSLLSFKPVLNKYLDKIEISSNERPKESFSLEPVDMEKISRLRRSIKEPHAVIISGLFNLIEHSERRFQLIQDDGSKLLGKVEPDFISEEDMRSFWGKKVTVKGTAYFNPSGKVRLIDAQIIKNFEPGEQVFDIVPERELPKEIVYALETKREGKSPFLSIWGKWPGEESIEDLLFTLKESSRED
jgi:hypothetical protein